jgi:aspartyl-tRNA(Asn)/glutamyl-tRNA(Gln) amidotransferase subunit C
LAEPKSPHKRHESYLIIHSTYYENWGFPLSITNRDVARISELARLELSPAEAELALGQLNSVLGLIEALQAVDTAGVAPMTHAGDLSLRLRPDVVTESDRRDDYQRSAPAVDHGLYLVPRVIE